MGRILFFLLLIFNSFVYMAQNYGNEWINYSQQYFAIPVVQNSIYRINQEFLQQSGIPVETLNVGQYKIYGKQQEVPLWVNDLDSNGVLDPGEFIEFFGYINDGWLDSLLYDNPDAIANPRYSLYNDTLNYFLTWSEIPDGLRFQEETDIAYTSYPAANFVMRNINPNWSTVYYEGHRVIGGSSSFFQDGEGWGRAQINKGQSYTQNYNVTGYYNGVDAPSAVLHTKVTSNSNAAANGVNNHHLRLRFNGTTIVDTIYNGYQQVSSFRNINTSTFSSNSIPLQMQVIDDLGAATDFQALTYGRLTLPSNLNINNVWALRYLRNHSNATKSSYQFTNLTGANPRCFIFDGNIPKKIPITSIGNSRWAVIPNAEFFDEQTMVLVTDNGFITIAVMSPVNGTGFFVNYITQNIENALLFVHPPGLLDGVEEYRTYRQSVQGGSYNVVLANVDDLYMQYGGGVPKHALGIRRFAKHIYDATTAKPIGLFLIGKGVREADETGGAQPGARKNNLSYQTNFVPSFGYPSSDAGFTARFNGDTWAPAISTGRLAAKNNQEVLAYLDKVKQHVINQDPNSVYNSAAKDWQKQVLHFGGGSSAQQINQLAGYLNNLGNKVEDNRFGGNVNTYIKEDSNPFNPTVLSSVSNRINEGVSVMTFFSHASGGGFEINIDQPESWQNSGKYPVVIGNSCYTGDMFMQTAITPTERFVLIEDKGAIAFISTVKQGFINQLYLHSNALYNQFCLDGYGETLGSQLLNTANILYQTYPNNLTMQATTMQMNLHGDPMIKINHHDKPEIEITNNSVTFLPEDIDLSTQEIEFILDIKNLGRSITDTFSIELRRKFPSQSVDSVYTKYLPRLNYNDTVKFIMPLQPDVAMGLNQFEVLVDIPSIIEEQYDELENNSILINYLLDVGGILPVFPYNYAVIPNNNPTIVASTINPFAEQKTYRFELDTTDLFNSPQHRFYEISTIGGVVNVQPNQWLGANSGTTLPLICPDSMVYFWRVSEQNPSAPENIWVEQSFQYIAGKTGWGQDHFFQFKNNAFSFLDYNRDFRQRDYLQVEADVVCNVFDNADNIQTWAGTNWYLNNSEIDYSICTTTPSLHVAVIDPITLEPWYTRGTVNGQVVNVNNNFGNANDLNNCRTRPEGYFIFRQNNATQRANFIEFVTNTIPDGHYVLIYSPIRAQYNFWDQAMFDAFAELNSDSIVPGKPNRAFAFFVKKGSTDNKVEEVAQFGGELITLQATLQGINGFGSERSVKIGPAANWETVYWKQNPFEEPNTDSTMLDLKGLNWAGNIVTQLNIPFTANDSLLNLNDQFSASLNPFLQLRSRHWDADNGTPSQIDRWHVLYEELPEAAIDAANGYYWTVENNAIQEGQQISFAVDVKNIGLKDMDSLRIDYWVQDVNLNKIAIPYARQDSLRVGEVIRDTITFSTQGLSGLHSFWIEVNPYLDANNTIKDQPEQFHFNNIAQLPFFVNRDVINPILDVTFDGLHILNGDIVSPKTEIVMSLKDENPFLIMNSDADTSLFAIYLTNPQGLQNRVYFIGGNGQVNLEWIPATGSQNKFKIIYNGNFEMDGKYELLVQGQDISGNISGDLEYRIQFEVIHESTITHLMNYPNPFSTSTKFVFTLTGERLPDHMIIQIMTITGTVVREITMAELGNLRIGRNVSDYAWDGRDNFGDQLANGVYLYTVLTSLDGEKIKHRDSGADDFFKKEFGKMYLLR